MFNRNFTCSTFLFVCFPTHSIYFLKGIQPVHLSNCLQKLGFFAWLWTGLMVFPSFFNLVERNTLMKCANALAKIMLILYLFHLYSWELLLGYYFLVLLQTVVQYFWSFILDTVLLGLFCRQWFLIKHCQRVGEQYFFQI